MELQEQPAGEEVTMLGEHLSQIDAPAELRDRILELSQTYGPELLTAVLGYIGIYLINKGSSRYGDLAGDENAEQQLAITKQASEQILIGGIAMAATAFAAGNPLFAYPEVVAIIASLQPYLDSRISKFASLSSALRMDVITKMAAIGVGTFITVEHAENVMQALPPLSLTSLAVAFSGHMRQEVYRILTLSGGSGLIVGASYSASEALQDSNTVGAIMSIAFLALNMLFTRNEWKEVQKMGGLRTVVRGACQAVQEKIRHLLGS